jgi:hypothetical protein
MIFCSIAPRFKKLFADKSFFYDTAMKNTPTLQGHVNSDSIRGRCFYTGYDISNLDNAISSTKAFTTNSDIADRVGFAAAPAPKSFREWRLQRPHIAFSIEVCAWFMHQMHREGYPNISRDRITQTQQPAFVGGVTDLASPVDGLVNLGYTMLHEVRLL